MINSSEEDAQNRRKSNQPAYSHRTSETDFIKKRIIKETDNCFISWKKFRTEQDRNSFVILPWIQGQNWKAKQPDCLRAGPTIQRPPQFVAPPHIGGQPPAGQGGAIPSLSELRPTETLPRRESSLPSSSAPSGLRSISSVCW